MLKDPVKEPAKAAPEAPKPEQEEKPKKAVPPAAPAAPEKKQEVMKKPPEEKKEPSAKEEAKKASPTIAEPSMDAAKEFLDLVLNEATPIAKRKQLMMEYVLDNDICVL